MSAGVCVGGGGEGSWRRGGRQAGCRWWDGWGRSSSPPLLPAGHHPPTLTPTPPLPFPAGHRPPRLCVGPVLHTSRRGSRHRQLRCRHQSVDHGPGKTGVGRCMCELGFGARCHKSVDHRPCTKGVGRGRFTSCGLEAPEPLLPPAAPEPLLPRCSGTPIAARCPLPRCSGVPIVALLRNPYCPVAPEPLFPRCSGPDGGGAG